MTVTETRHRTWAELEAGLARILAAPKDGGRIEAIVVRPRTEGRQDVAEVAISAASGVAGDHWAKGCWKSTPDGRPDPDVQICIMNARAIALIAGDRAQWPAAGDNLFVDLDLSPENLPPGTRLALGSAEIEITDVPHTGCAKFIARYGRDACVWVNTGPGKANRLRGIYAKVVKDGRIAVGDRVRKVG
jgi:MOSC domain-containing protein YiiM